MRSILLKSGQRTSALGIPKLRRFESKSLATFFCLPEVSTMLAKSICLRVVQKAEFLSNYRLMQTLLNYPKIMQIYCFIKYLRSSYLNFQIIFSYKAEKANNIQKTIFFVNCISEICLIISIFHFWIKKLGYSAELIGWIRPYHLAMSELDKSFIANTFAMLAD